MTVTRYFESPATWDAAEALLSFSPCAPKYTLGRTLQALRVHVRDHRQRELPVEARSLEAHYGAFVLSQCRKGYDASKRWALSVSYGRDARATDIAGHAGRMYELGLEVPPDDIDGRSPAVIAWHDGETFFLIASTELPASVLAEIACSIY